MLSNMEDAVQNADIVIECIEEDLDSKAKLFESKKFLCNQKS